MQTKHTVLFVVLGIVFWFAGAMFVRLTEPLNLVSNAPLLAVMYMVAIVILGVGLVIARFLSGLPLNALYNPTLLMTTTAMVFDGLAHGFFPSIYGTDPAHIVRGAGMIFWGGAIGIILTWWWSRSKPSAA